MRSDARVLTTAALLACSASACSPAPAEPIADTYSSTSTSTSTAESGDDETDDGPLLDLGEHDGEGCAKVDLLFLIDDSVSMVSEQGNLIASFPEFIEAIVSTLDSADSYHLGVITTDAYAFNDPECSTLGALVTQTGGDKSSAATCGPFGEGRYMTETDDLELGFACAGQVGIEGSNDERPMQALALALADADLALGCNAGFLREDALLVVVLITDEEDDHTTFLGQPQGSPGEPQDWFDAVVAAKAGIESNVVVLSIIGGLPQNECPFPKGSGAEDSPRLTEFTDMFTHGFLGDVCAWSYGPFFMQAVDVIDTACDNFMVP